MASWIFYNPSKNQISSNLSLDHYSPNYDSILILGDFDSEMSEDPMIEFRDTNNFKKSCAIPYML